MWVPSRLNKRSREDIAEIDWELINRANRLGWGYQPIAANRTGARRTSRRFLKMRGKVKLSETKIYWLLIYGRNEAHYVQIKNIVGAVTKGMKTAESTIKKTEMEIMLDLKTKAEPSTDADLNKLKLAKTRNNRYMAPEGYKQQFNSLSMKWGLICNDDRTIVPNELRNKLLDTLHYEHAGTKKWQKLNFSGGPISHKKSRKKEKNAWPA